MQVKAELVLMSWLGEKLLSDPRVLLFGVLNGESWLQEKQVRTRLKWLVEVHMSGGVTWKMVDGIQAGWSVRHCPQAACQGLTSVGNKAELAVVQSLGSDCRSNFNDSMISFICTRI